MANEITLTAALSIIKNGISIAASVTKQVTQAGSGFASIEQEIGVATERLGGASGFTDIDDLGYLFIKNLDATNFVMIGLATPVTAGDAFAVLLPGEAWCGPCRQETIYGLADTLACKVQIIALEK